MCDNLHGADGEAMLELIPHFSFSPKNGQYWGFSEQPTVAVSNHGISLKRLGIIIC